MRWLVAAALLIPRVLDAQLSLRAGGLVARYGGVTSGSAVSIAPRAEWTDGLARGVLEASYSRFSSGPWALQGGFEASTSYNALAGAVGLTFASAGNLLEGGNWSGSLRGMLGFARAFGRVTGGVGVGTAYVRSMTTEAADRHDNVVVSLGAQGATGTVLLRGEFVFAPPGDYNDGTLVLSRRRGPLSLEVMGGARFFSPGPTEAIWQAGVSYALSAPVVLEMSAGRWPSSPEGFARGFYASAGVRLRGRDPARAPATIERIAGGQVRVTLSVPGERSVSIGGDWNEWTPIPMRKEQNGRWSVELPLGPGAHRFGIRIGEEWRVPDGVPSLPDDFGGRVGLLVVG